MAIAPLGAVALTVALAAPQIGYLWSYDELTARADLVVIATPVCRLASSAPGLRWTSPKAARSTSCFYRGAAFAAAAGTAGANATDGVQLARSGVCMREWAAFVRVAPLQQTPKVMRKLKKVRDVPARYPDLPPGTKALGTSWAGEFLINQDGHVAHVWPTREIRFTPPFPPFNEAIVDAVQKWRYEPPIADGKPVSVCASMALSVNWQ